MEKTTYIQHAIESWITREQEPYASEEKPRLWASDMNKCARKALVRVTHLAKETVKPTTQMQLYFQAGNMWEDDTAAALRWHYGEALQEQLVLKDDIWSGKCDFALHHGDDSQQTVLIEHKAKGDKWWNYNDALPQNDHIGQLYIYWYLYKKIYGVEPKLVLFYRTWGHYAEFYIEPQPDGAVMIHGTIDGQAVVKRKGLRLHAVREELEIYYTTGEVPPRLLDKSEGCTFKGQPSCAYYHYCWGVDDLKELGKTTDEDTIFLAGTGQEKSVSDIRF